jgi:uncharacterized SAM-dependent methyltransferase
VKYFKNTELAKIYNVSEKSVRNWVQATQEGKLALELHTGKNRVYVANTTKNTALIEQLVKKGKKYKNTRGAKTITPKKIFYELYEPKQILDIISSFTIHHESPLQYTYVNGGAEDWDRYAHRLIDEQEPNILTRTTEFLELNAGAIDSQLNGHKKINVVDLGPGNGLPVRALLERLLKEGRLNRYIAIDISQDMLDILEQNIKRWFGGKIRYEGYTRDISYERFNDILDGELADESTANLVLFLGGTLANFRAPDQILQTINNSLGLNDLLIYTGYLDTPKTRRYFDYYTSDGKLPIQDGLIVNLLNIDESLYDVQLQFDEVERARSISIRPRVDLSIKVDLANGVRQLNLLKEESILIWRHRHYTGKDLIRLFDRNGLNFLHASKSPEQNYFLLISKIKVG